MLEFDSQHRLRVPGEENSNREASNWVLFRGPHTNSGFPFGFPFQNTETKATQEKTSDLKRTALPDLAQAPHVHE